MAGAISRKSAKDPSYKPKCGLCSFLDASRVAAEPAAERLRTAEKDLAIVRDACLRFKADEKLSQRLIAPLQKIRRQAIRDLVATGQVIPLLSHLEEWIRFGNRQALQDVTDAVGRRAQPDPRLLDDLAQAQEHLCAQIDSHDDDQTMRNELRSEAAQLSRLALECIFGRELFLLAAIALAFAAKLREATATPTRIPLVPGDRGSVTGDTSFRKRLIRVNAAGLL